MDIRGKLRTLLTDVNAKHKGEGPPVTLGAALDSLHAKAPPKRAACQAPGGRLKAFDEQVRALIHCYGRHALIESLMLAPGDRQRPLYLYTLEYDWPNRCVLSFASDVELDWESAAQEAVDNVPDDDVEDAGLDALSDYILKHNPSVRPCAVPEGSAFMVG
jgi:hypothetical protein